MTIIRFWVIGQFHCRIMPHVVAVAAVCYALSGLACDEKRI